MLVKNDQLLIVISIVIWSHCHVDLSVRSWTNGLLIYASPKVDKTFSITTSTNLEVQNNVYFFGWCLKEGGILSWLVLGEMLSWLEVRLVTSSPKKENTIQIHRLNRNEKNRCIYCQFSKNTWCMYRICFSSIQIFHVVI